MARIRLLKPGFFLDDELAELPFEWRLLYQGLWVLSDREGRLEDRPLRIKAEVFPYDAVDIHAGLARLADAGKIRRYVVGELRVIAIPTFRKHQQPHIREAASALPADPSAGASPRALDAPPEKPGAGTVQALDEHWPSPSDPDPDPVPVADPDPVTAPDQPREARPASALRASFDRVFRVYPRQEAEEPAWRVWQRLQPDEAMTEEILAGIETQRPGWTDLTFVPILKNFLKDRRWRDPVAPPRIDEETRRRMASVRRMVGIR